MSIEIPKPQPRVAIPQEELDKVLELAVNNKAAIIKLRGQPYINFQAKLRYEFMIRGYRMSYRQNGDDTITVWADRIIAS